MTNIMKFKLSLLAVFILITLSSCAEKSSNDHASHSPKPAASSSANVPTNSTATSETTKTVSPKNGDYDGKGLVTKVDLKIGSVEIDHEDIPGVMPPMKMEFYVSDKKILDGIKVGDRVDFVLRYKDHTETVVNIKKAK
jgi:Cu/Ag efflux protein CusF